MFQYPSKQILFAVIVATAFTIAWVRSESFIDRGWMWPLGKFASGYGAVYWEKEHSTDSRFKVPEGGGWFGFYTMSKFQKYGEYVLIEDDPKNGWPRWRFLGLGSGEFGVVYGERWGLSEEHQESIRVRYWRIPYWVFIVPPTIYSIVHLFGHRRRHVRSSPISVT